MKKRSVSIRGHRTSLSLEDIFWDELAQIAFLDSEHKLAQLADLLALVDGKVPLLIEIKSKRGYDVEPSCRGVRDALKSYEGRHAVMSFDPRVSRWFRRHSPQTLPQPSEPHSLLKHSGIQPAEPTH